MKVAKYWCYVIVLPGASHNTSCRVLDGLELLHQAVTVTSDPLSCGLLYNAANNKY